jgi:hypothetical protein
MTIGYLKASVDERPEGFKEKKGAMQFETPMFKKTFPVTLLGYTSLRLCLQLRQNPPACAPWGRVLLWSGR